MAIKYFRITVKDGGTNPTVLDEQGRSLLGAVSAEINGKKARVKMKFRDLTKREGFFTVSPIFEDHYCAVIRHDDGAIAKNISDIIMNDDGRYTMVIIQ
jgi:hypothetical protein